MTGSSTSATKGNVFGNQVEMEREKNAELAMKVAVLEAEVENLQARVHSLEQGSVVLEQGFFSSSSPSIELAPKLSIPGIQVVKQTTSSP